MVKAAAETEAAPRQTVATNKTHTRLHLTTPSRTCVCWCVCPIFGHQTQLCICLSPHSTCSFPSFSSSSPSFSSLALYTYVLVKSVMHPQALPVGETKGVGSARTPQEAPTATTTQMSPNVLPHPRPHNPPFPRTPYPLRWLTHWATIPQCQGFLGVCGARVLKINSKSFCIYFVERNGKGKRDIF